MKTSRKARAPRALKRREFAPPPNAVAAIFLAPGSCVYQRRNDSMFTSKTVTPATLRLAFAQEPITSGWLPEGVVLWGVSTAGAYMVGYYPPAVRAMRVRFGNRVRRLRVPLPGLVFAGLGEKYYVWAMRGRGFDPKAQLYRAPLPNLNEHGLICYGANEHPDVRTGGYASSWRMFWDAPFSDHHAGERSRRHPKDVREHLLALARSDAKSFPASALIPMNVTVESAVERLVTRGRGQ
jgi:PRTRC genetic system protein B